MQALNKSQPYSTRQSEDGKTWYCQNGLEYDLKGQPMDKKAVIRRANETAAEIQARADEAMEAAQAAQKEAAEQIAALTGEPGAVPETVAELTAALVAAGIEIPDGSKKADLQQLYAASQEG